MEFNLEQNSISVKCEGVTAVIYFDGGDISYCCIEDCFEAGIDDDIAAHTFVKYSDEFVSVRDLMIMADRSYNDIYNEAIVEAGYEADHVSELCSPYLSGRV